MPADLAASIADVVLGLRLGATGQQAGNRVSIEGLTTGPGPEGALAIGVEKFEAASLRLASGAHTLEFGHVVLHKVVGQVGVAEGRPRLLALEATEADISGLKVHGPLTLPPPAKGHTAPAPVSSSAWTLGPLAAAEGTIRAEIVDAHLLFDAQVKVPIRLGQVKFADATVEHVGPDSRMGVSRMGIYVDAPNGRSYLYQFTSAAVAGVQFERRGALLGPFVSDRGTLQLQAFGEGLLRQGLGRPDAGLTDQARQLFDRTAVQGHLQLGDGKFAAPGVQAEAVGSAQKHNTIRVHSGAVGRGLTVEVASLSVRNVVLDLGGTQLACDTVSGSVTLQLSVQGSQLRFAFDVGKLKLSGLRLRFPAR